MTTTEIKETNEIEVMEMEAIDVVNEIEAENSGSVWKLVGLGAAAIGAGYLLVKKVVIPGAKKIKAKLNEKKAEKEAMKNANIIDGEVVSEEEE